MASVNGKKILAFGLASVMLLGTLGCGSKGSGAGEENPNKDQVSQKGKIEFPLKEQITVSIAGKRPDGYVAFGETEVMKKAEKDTNMKINWIDWPASSIQEKKGIAFSTNVLPDAMYGSYLMTPQEIVKYSEQGFLASISDYLEEGAMPNLEKIFEKRPQFKTEFTAPDKKIYGLPACNERDKLNASPNAIVINKKWLEKVNKEMPTTTDEFYDVLKAFKAAGDLNGNGKNDEIPFTFRYNDNVNGMKSVVGWFGTALAVGKGSVIKDGKVVCAETSDDYKDAMIYLNKLYSEGLLDPEVFTMDNSMYRGKAKAGTCGVISIWSTYEVNGNEGDDYVYLPPLKSPNGKTPEWESNAFSYTNTAMVISEKSKYKKELAAWGDRFLDPEISIDTFLGGPKYVQKTDKGYVMLKNEKGVVPDWSEKSWYSPANGSLMVALSDDYKLAELSAPDASKLASNDVYAEYVPKEIYKNWYMTTEENAEVSDYLPDVESFMDKSTADFVTKGNIEAGWKSYVDKLNSLGMTKILKVRQTVYDRYK